MFSNIYLHFTERKGTTVFELSNFLTMSFFLQDILDALEIERIVEDCGDSLLMYIPLDKKPNTQDLDIPELPEIPLVIPVRVGKFQIS